MGQMIEFVRSDGRKVSGYLALPTVGENAPGVVVTMEWWGLLAPLSNAPEVCDRLAAAGYRALAPDFFDGKVAATSDEARAQMKTLDWASAVNDIGATVAHLKAYHQAGGKVAVLGFCMGGALAMLSALRAPGVDAVVSFYGVPPEQAGDPGRIKVPLLGHYAARDESIPTAIVDALEKKLTAGRVPHTLHRYDAAHAFMNDKRKDVHDATCAQLAWQRTIAFLDEMLD